MYSLSSLLENWKRQLTSWAQEGAISRAAVDALRLEEEPKALEELVARWSAGQFQDLPPVVVLPASSMAGAAGAYAISTGTIYLNQEWLQSASEAQAMAVLTEELGHHLDGLLNASDTPGDEGELFAALLDRGGLLSEPERLALQAEDDRGRVLVAGRELEVEQAFGDIFNLPPASTYSIERLKSDWDEGHSHSFLIKREGGLSAPGQVRFSTSSDSASESLDFNAYSVIRNFKVNQREDIVYVDSRTDTLTEGEERFNVSISTVKPQDEIKISSTFGRIFNRFFPLISDQPVASTSSFGDVNIDGLISPNRWAPTSLGRPVGFGFPTSIDDYEPNYQYRSEYAKSFKGFNDLQKQAARNWLIRSFNSFGQFAPTGDEYSPGRDATIRLAMSNYSGKEDGKTNRAHGFNPSVAYVAGDVWLNTADYNTPLMGNNAYFVMGHELGHALGLQHPHEHEVRMNPDRDAIEFTIMSYRSYAGAPLEYRNEENSFPQSLMMNDIAALQYLYGVSYAGGNSRYTFSPKTGEMSVNGFGQGKPSSNRIFRTIWDGGGWDTYDFSNYTTNLNIDLKPGGWSNLHSGGGNQRAILQTRIGPKGGIREIKYAGGHVYNALEHKGDSRSLIEAAIGGSANDRISGNRVDNEIKGQAGNDTIYGGAGEDFLLGDAGNDILFGETDSDVIKGGFGNDTIYGGPGNDELLGDAGNDVINGDLGMDVLMGVSLDAGRTPGKGTKDTLTGGPNKDTFIVGAGKEMFYSDGSSATPGRGDYAKITDFSFGDIIQLSGKASDYLLKKDDSVGFLSDKGYGLYRNDGIGVGATAGLDARDEFIALIQAQKGLILNLRNPTQFQFV